MKLFSGYMKNYRIKVWGFLFLVFGLVLLMNIFSIPAHDELSYAFLGQSTPSVGNCARVASLGDIVNQQIKDYNTANGRVLIHGIVAFFSGFRLYYLFDIINSFVWMVLVSLIMKEAGLNQTSLKDLTFCHGLAFIFIWYPETTFMNAAFAINYLWTSVFAILMVRLWNRNLLWRHMIAFAVFGFTQEVFVLPFIVAAMIDCLIKCFVRDRNDLAKRLVAIILLIPGACSLVFSPGAMRRATGSFTSIGEMITILTRCVAGLVVAVWPVVLFIIFLGVLWRVKHSLWTFVRRNSMLVLFTGASLGLFALGCKNGIYRLLMPTFIGCLILILKERSLQREYELQALKWLSFAGLAFMIVATGVQINMGLSNIEFLKRYKQDPQGVSYHRVVTPFLCYNACSSGLWNEWHNSLWRLEYGKENPPIRLNRYLYENLYTDSTKFFVEAHEFESGWFVTDKAIGIAVKKGIVDKERPKGFRAFQNNAQHSKYLPGRLAYIFPSESDDLMIPHGNVCITTLDGQLITIVQDRD